MPILGPEQNPDPNLTSASGWTLGAGWSKVAGGFYHAPGVAGVLQIGPLTAGFNGEVVRCVLGISQRAAGGCRSGKDSSTPIVVHQGVGYFETIQTLSGTGTIFASANSTFDGTINFLSVRSYNSMALTEAGDYGGFELHVVLTDSSGVDVSKVVYKLIAADYAAAVAAKTTILTRLATVSDAVVKGYSIIQRFVESALALPANVEIENRASISARITGDPTKTANVVIPAANIGIFQNGTGSGRNKVDVVDSNLLTYLATWQLTGGLAVLSDGEFLDDTNVIVEGKRNHRHSSDG